MNHLDNLLKNIKLPQKGQIFYIWGAGNWAMNAHPGMLRENLYKKLNITFYIDKKQSGKIINNLPVYSPDILDTFNKDKIFILICSSQIRIVSEIEESLDHFGIQHSLLDTALIKVCFEKIIKTSQLFDEKSREIYFRILGKRITLDPIDDDLFAGKLYFGIPEFCIVRPDDIFLDCEAYVGDSIERFIWRIEQFYKIIAVEPDQNNMKAILVRRERLMRIWNMHEGKKLPIHAGLDEKTFVSGIQPRADGLASIQVNVDVDNSETLFFGSVDVLLSNHKISLKVTYIKAVIEGYKYKMLKGAKNTIKKCKPKNAICIYHNAIDIYSITQLIHEINPSFKLSVRHHSYNIVETVLYAY